MSMSWENASSWGNAWGQSELTDAQKVKAYNKRASSRATAGDVQDVSSAISDLTNVGIQVGELISTNRFQKQMLREKKAENRNVRRANRRMEKYRRKDQARASMLQQRLAALTAITGTRTKNSLIAGIGIVVLAGIFLLATKPPKPQPYKGSPQ